MSQPEVIIPKPASELAGELANLPHLQPAQSRRRFASLEMLAEMFTEVMTDVITAETLADAGADITAAQLECLKYLQRHGACSAAEIAEGLDMSPPAATKLVDRLVRKGLVSRRENPADRRSVEIALTAKGRDAVAELRARRSMVLETILGRMSAEHRAMLDAALRAFLAAGASAPETVEALCLRCGDESDPECPLIWQYRDLTGSPMQCK